MHPALHSSIAHSKGNVSVSRFNTSPRDATDDVRILRRGPPFELPLAACNETPKGYRPHYLDLAAESGRLQSEAARVSERIGHEAVLKRG